MKGLQLYQGYVKSPVFWTLVFEVTAFLEDPRTKDNFLFYLVTVMAELVRYFANYVQERMMTNQTAEDRLRYGRLVGSATRWTTAADVAFQKYFA